MTLKTHEVSDLRDSQILEKMQKLIRKLPKHFANCELETANSNPAIIRQYYPIQVSVNINKPQPKF